MAAKNTSTKKIKRPKSAKSGKTSAADVELASAKAAIKKLKATVRLLEKNVAKAEKKVDGLKTELKKLRGGAVAKVKEATLEVAPKSKKSKKSKQSKKSESIAEHAAPAAEPATAPEPVPETPPEPELAAEPDTAAPKTEPTVAQLRAAAREQGIAGYSSMRKQQLIDALS